MMYKYCFTILMLWVLVSFISPGFTQTKTFAYEYDDSGNRKERKLILLKTDMVAQQTEYSQEQEKVFEEELNGFNIKIFPNPTKGNLTVQVTCLGERVGQIMVFNSLGVLIMDKKIATHSESINLIDQPSGIYFMTILVDGNTTQWKIIKE